MITFKKVIALHKQGDLEGTQRGCREILKHEPEHLEALSLLGVVEFETGNSQVALALLNRLVELCPDNPTYFTNRAKVLAALGEIGASISQCLELIEKYPENASHHLQLGDLYREQGRLELALEHYETAARLEPGSARPLLNVGRLHMDMSRPQEALHCFEQAQSIEPQSRDIKLARVNALSVLLKADQAVDILEGLRQASGGNDPLVLSQLGQTLGMLGQKEQALVYLRKALELKPDLYKNYAVIVDLERKGCVPKEIERMRELLDETGIGDEHRLQIAFGLGRALGDLGDYAEAFRCIHLANTLRRKVEPENSGNYQAFRDTADAYRKAYRRALAPPVSLLEEEQEPGPSPVFLVGMPRSGSTLAEHLLTRHSQVDPGGEFAYLVNALHNWSVKKGFTDRNQGLRMLVEEDPESLQSIRGQYLAWLNFHRENGRIVTDKMLYNFQHIGPILQLFPGACIIECARNPMDTGWSIYRTSFAEDHHYADELGDIARVYGIYGETMKFWRELYPERIYRLQYEDVIADPESEIRKLLAYCGLDYEEACLTPSANPRAVRTASMSQVREPFYQGSVGAWRAYEPFLQPLIEGLGDLYEDRNP